MKQFQRFLYSILFIVFCSISSLAQNHLEFMQISIDGDLDSFEQKLLEKDFSKSYHSYLVFFYKTLCSVSVKVDPTTEKVHKISINFCQGTTNLTKNEIENKFQGLIKDYSTKYGKTKCKLIDNNFIVTLPNGYITCQIFWPPISLGGTRVEINYVDKANTTDYTIPSFKKASEDL